MPAVWTIQSAIKIPSLPIGLDIPILLDVKNSTIKDLKDAIKERFNNEVDVEIETNGRLRIIDNYLTNRLFLLL